MPAPSQELGWRVSLGNEYMNQLTDAGIPAAAVEAKKTKSISAINLARNWQSLRRLVKTSQPLINLNVCVTADNSGSLGRSRCAAKWRFCAKPLLLNLPFA